MQALQTESRILRKEVENLREGTTIFTNKFQSAEVISKPVPTDANLFKKEIRVLKEETRSLFNTTRSTELILEMVQSNSNSFLRRDSVLWRRKWLIWHIKSSP